MSTGRVVIGGSTGFMGSHLVSRLRAEGREVVTISRSGADIRWGDQVEIDRAVDGASLVIGLAGKSVNCRYTPENRAEIFRSRLDTTTSLSTAIARASAPPALWVNSSTATIYRHAEDRPMTESTGELGTGFSVEVAKAWEKALFAEELPATRRVALRSAIVLGHGGVLGPLKNLVRLGLGGPQYDGRWPATAARRRAGTVHRFRARRGSQRFSWVHIDDVIAAIRFLETRDDIDGVVNVASPNPSDNRTLMRTLRRIVGARFGLPAWRFMLEPAMWVIRTEPELVLKSRWVVPERLIAAGFRFSHPALLEALQDVAPRR